MAPSLTFQYAKNRGPMTGDGMNHSASILTA